MTEVNMKTCTRLLLIWVLFPLVFVSTVFAGSYYVDRNHASASDANPGTFNLPWLTIQHAADEIGAGDTVFIRSGVYHEQVLTTNNGSANDGYIVFSAYPGETPIIDGIGVQTGSTGILISHSYLKFTGLEIRNWDSGIWMEFASHIDISYCEVHECVFGIGASFGTHDFLLDHVLMHHFDLYGFDASPGGGLDCYNGTLNNCIAHTGRDPQQNVDGFALGHGTQHNFVFNNCIAYNVFDGFDISSRGTTLNSCLGYDCWNGAYKLWQDDVKLINSIGYGSVGANVELDWDSEPGKTTLINCTFFNAASYNIWVENTNDTLAMYNCIVAGGDNIGLAFELPGVNNYYGDYNIFHNDNPDRSVAVAYTDEFSLEDVHNGSWSAYSGQDNNSIVVFDRDAIFTDANNNDLHLLSSSAAVDNGTAAGAPAEDYEGNPRPSGQGYDIGAFEYQFPTGIGDPLSDEQPHVFILYQNYPNPLNPTTHIKYSIPKRTYVRLKVFDILGKEITTLVDEEKAGGEHEVMFDIGDLSSGIYFYRLEAGSFVRTKKMILLH
jgi:hypothetical protein